MCPASQSPKAATHIPEAATGTGDSLADRRAEPAPGGSEAAVADPAGAPVAQAAHRRHCDPPARWDPVAIAIAIASSEDAKPLEVAGRDRPHAANHPRAAGEPATDPGPPSGRTQIRKEERYRIVSDVGGD